MVSTIDYREFKTYLTCPLLWSKIYLHHQSVNKFISYKDLYNSDLEKVKQDIIAGNLNVETEQFLKAKAIQDYIKELNIDSYTIEGVEYKKDNDFKLSFTEENKFLFKENNLEIILPIPIVFKNDRNEYLILNTKIISSNPMMKGGHDILVYLQKKALYLITGQKDIPIINLEITSSSIKMKKKETDEEFEKRKLELLKKSKTGITKAKQQTGETDTEFYERYKNSLTHNIFNNKNNNILLQNIISTNVYYFGKLTIPLHPQICKFCSYDICN